jgi:rhodanese-related sulfurtransferase
VLRHVERTGQLVDVRSPEEYAGTRLHMPEFPNEGALRGGHIPGAKSIPWARAVNPDDGTFKPASELKALYLEQNGLSPRPGDDRLLPHRRAQQPHVVRAEVPARLRERPQLRRQLDRVGEPGGRAH